MPEVRDRALAIIDAGGDTARWAEQDKRLARQREQVLRRLGEKLRGPQPEPKSLRRPRPLAVRFELGDVVRLRNDEAKAQGLVVVVDRMEYPRGSIHLVLEALIWDSGELPSAGDLERLPSLKTDRGLRASDLTVGPTGVL